LMVAAVRMTSDGGALDIGDSRPLFPVHVLAPIQRVGTAGDLGRQQYMVSADGRFLVNTVLEETTTSPITLIVNWAGPKK